MENFIFCAVIVIRNGKIVWKVVLIRVFVAELEFPNILVSRLPENTSNVNIESNEKSKQWYYLCD